MKNILPLLLLSTTLTANSPSHTEQIAQNQVIERLNLLRIKDSKQLNALIRRGRLVPIRSTAVLSVESGLPMERRYCLVSTLVLLEELSARYHERFGEPIVVTSAVRTMQVQSWLLRFNRNAAPIHGEAASSHMTGATVDISRRHMTREQDRFVEGALEVYTLYNKAIYIKENTQRCFHIFVIPEESFEGHRNNLQNNEGLPKGDRRAAPQPLPAPSSGSRHGWPRIN